MSQMDEHKLNEYMEDVQINSLYVSDLVESLVKECCDKLDNYISDVRNILNDSDYVLTNEELDDIIMIIPTLLYFVGTQQELLGIKQDVSQSTRNLLYNRLYATMTGTEGTKKANVSAQLFNEDLVSIVYARAYNQIKCKISFATEILQSAKKVMSRRISEFELSKVSPTSNRM